MDVLDPRHGTNAGAVQHWKDGETSCEPCRTAARRSRKGAALDQHRGLPRTVRLGEAAWEAIRTTPRNQLSAKTGFAADKLLRYEKAGPDTLVHRATQQRILAAGCDWTPLGIQRRLQALSRLGWSMRVIAEATGLDMDGLKRLRRRRELVFVRRTVAEAVVAIYKEYEMRLPPSGPSERKVKADARARGWLPPLCWDDIDRDETPMGVRTPKRRDLLAEWHDLRDAGESIEQAAVRLGVTVGAIERAEFRRKAAA